MWKEHDDRAILNNTNKDQCKKMSGEFKTRKIDKSKTHTEKNSPTKENVALPHEVNKQGLEKKHVYIKRKCSELQIFSMWTFIHTSKRECTFYWEKTLVSSRTEKTEVQNQ